MTFRQIDIRAYERTRSTPWVIGTIRAYSLSASKGNLYYIYLGRFGIRLTHYNFQNWNHVTNFWSYDEYEEMFRISFDKEDYSTE